MAWYQVKGNEQDVVFSSRIRFARNIEGYAFGERLTAEDAKKVILCMLTRHIHNA